VSFIKAKTSSLDDRPEEVRRFSEARSRVGETLSFAIDEESAKGIM
jgi:hypothetical protein